jgi:hypothetical protein
MTIMLCGVLYGYDDKNKASTNQYFDHILEIIDTNKQICSDFITFRGN